MAVRIVIKNSATEDKRPTPGQLENGEIALNYNAAGSFLTCKDTDGNIQQVGGVKISEVAPESPVKQTLWFQPSSLTLFVYDGDSFLPIAGGSGGGTPGSGITTIIGNNGIDASEIAGVVTLDVELAGGDDGLEFDVGKLKASVASASQLGSVKIGDGIDIALDGTISVDIPQALTFRGSVDLGQPPTGQINPNPPLTGDAYVASFNTDPIDAGWTGIGGDAAVAGDLAVFDGTNWELINTGGTMQGVEGGAGIISSTSGGIATVAVDAGAGLGFDADDKLIVSGYPDLSGSDLDERYLRKDAGTFDQTVLSTGTTTFDGLTKHSKAIELTGKLEGAYRIYKDDEAITIEGENSNKATLCYSSSTLDIGFVASNEDLIDRTSFAGFQINSHTQPKGSFQCIGFSNNISSQVGEIEEARGFSVQGKTDNSLAKNLYGYFGQIYANAATRSDGLPSLNWNLFAIGTAPNFFETATFIGGTTARNTRELWEETLTDEQKEQLAAGTLAIPANVSLPGDGSFVRQWWYDQQSAENQALIDSGELEYPEHFQAANFVDTFDLGVTTNINLNTNGYLEVRGGLNIRAGGDTSNIRCGITSSGSTNLSFFTLGQNHANMNKIGSIDFSSTVTLPASPTNALIADKRNVTGDQDGRNYISFNASPVFTDTRVFTSVAGIAVSDSFDCNIENKYGVFVDISIRDNKDASIDRNSYSFASRGNATFYNRGAITGGSTLTNAEILAGELPEQNPSWTIAADGTATGITVTRAAVVTDEQAGTVETLLDIITDLRARVEALEAAATS